MFALTGKIGPTVTCFHCGKHVSITRKDVFLLMRNMFPLSKVVFTDKNISFQLCLH